MSSNFDFLPEKFPVLADYGQKAEKYLYIDSNSGLGGEERLQNAFAPKEEWPYELLEGRKRVRII